MPRAERVDEPALSMHFGIARAAMRIKAGDGRVYIFATELPAGPRAAFGASRPLFLWESAIAFLVSGCICWLLTRHITRPILDLRNATRQLAEGALNTRAVADAAHRRDEIGALIADFNLMANGIDTLVTGQRQLIYDISHELRSPLARLNIALDLIRSGRSVSMAYEHMERDLASLDELSERLLTIARLDATPAPSLATTVDFSGLVIQIVRDAEFESQEKNIALRLTFANDLCVQGNPALLSSAVENVVRNAIHYTGAGTSVEISLTREPSPKGDIARLVIQDHGPGVPEPELQNIFRPFYRTAEARDRKSGGAGLGLAIADRVARAHQGTIIARNLEAGDLRLRSPCLRSERVLASSAHLPQASLQNLSPLHKS
jgi:two-component system sensor histidine kinase CpxA